MAGQLLSQRHQESDFLSEYVRHFNGIFLNATFYQVYGAEQVVKWKNQAAGNPDFKFYPVPSQKISHLRRSRNVEEVTSQYLTGIRAQGEQLGPVLLQPGDNFSYKSFPALCAYVETFPGDVGLFVEPLHKDWWKPEWLDKLDKRFHNNKTGFALTDAPGRRDGVHMHLTVPGALIRFAAAGDMALGQKRLDEWAARLKDWRNRGLQSAGFFITGPEERHTPALCRCFSAQMA